LGSGFGASFTARGFPEVFFGFGAAFFLVLDFAVPAVAGPAGFFAAWGVPTPFFAGCVDAAAF
jgi:hypothetical protein